MKKWILILMISTVSSAVGAKQLAHGYTSINSELRATFTQRTFNFNSRLITINYRCTSPRDESNPSAGSFSYPSTLEHINSYTSNKREKVDFIDYINAICGY